MGTNQEEYYSTSNLDSTGRRATSQQAKMNRPGVLKSSLILNSAAIRVLVSALSVAASTLAISEAIDLADRTWFGMKRANSAAPPGVATQLESRTFIKVSPIPNVRAGKMQKKHVSADYAKPLEPLHLLHLWQ